MYIKVIVNSQMRPGILNALSVAEQYLYGIDINLLLYRIAQSESPYLRISSSSKI